MTDGWYIWLEWRWKNIDISLLLTLIESYNFFLLINFSL